MSLKSIFFLGLLTSTLFAQSKSAVQFYDTTGATKTGKIGWTGDAVTGSMFIQTPQNGVVLQTQPGVGVQVAGGVTASGNVTATKFIGDGSTLTNLPTVAAPTVGTVTGLQDSLNAKASAASVTSLQGQVGAKADSNTVNTKLNALQTQILRKADTAWVDTQINKMGKGSIASVTGNSGITSNTTSGSVTLSITPGGIDSSKILTGAVYGAKIAANAVDSSKIKAGSIYGPQISSTAALNIGSLTTTGAVGIGTANPYTKLHVVGYDPTYGTVAKFERGGSEKPFYIRPYNLDHVRLESAGFLSFGINAGDATFGTEAMVINGAGNVGIGTTSPVMKLDVYNANVEDVHSYAGLHLVTHPLSGSDVSLALAPYAADYGDVPEYQNKAVLQTYGTNIALSAFGPTDQIQFYTGGRDAANKHMTIDNNGNVIIAGTVTANGTTLTSDRRYKTDIMPIDSSLSKVSKLQGVYYNWDRAKWPKKNFPEGKQVGLIAQEVEKVVPEVVNTDKEGYKSLSYDKLTAVLINAMKELEKKVTVQDSIIISQNNRIAILEKNNKK
jgi:Chaperone of endosialidase